MPEVAIIDLDQIAAARREATAECPVVRFGGEEFTLPPEMPFAIIEAVGRMQNEDEATRNAALAESMGDIAHSLFGSKYRKFLDMGPSVQDISALLESVPKVYGLVESAEETPEPAID